MNSAANFMDKGESKVKLTLQLFCALCIITGGLIIDGRRVTTADTLVGADTLSGDTIGGGGDCTPPVQIQETRPPEPINKPKPVIPDAAGGDLVSGGGCPCGCACEGGCNCSVAGPCSASCDCAGYAAMRAKAIREGKPLLVIVGGVPQDFKGVIPEPKGWLSCFERSIEGVKGPCLLVGVPRDGELWRVADLPITAKLAEMEAALKPKTTTVARPAASRTVCIGGK